uniref:Uncharacterized protein n=1 Tax=Panagrolaimus sp. PS1159 TaxID=55785 RepID=A0AC35F6J8_9BILA
MIVVIIGCDGYRYKRASIMAAACKRYPYLGFCKDKLVGAEIQQEEDIKPQKILPSDAQMKEDNIKEEKNLPITKQAGPEKMEADIQPKRIRPKSKHAALEAERTEENVVPKRSQPKRKHVLLEPETTEEDIEPKRTQPIRKSPKSSTVKPSATKTRPSNSKSTTASEPIPFDSERFGDRTAEHDRLEVTEIKGEKADLQKVSDKKHSSGSQQKQLPSKSQQQQKPVVEEPVPFDTERFAGKMGDAKFLRQETGGARRSIEGSGLGGVGSGGGGNLGSFGMNSGFGIGGGGGGGGESGGGLFGMTSGSGVSGIPGIGSIGMSSGFGIGK